jgi:ATP-dependent Clp protease ATP-binding subunit ClpC
MYERFTDRARKVMVLADEEAMRLQNDYIDSGHILVGLIREGSGVAANVLKNLGLDLHKIRVEVAKLVESEPDKVTIDNLPLTSRAKKVMEYSMAEAIKLKHNYVGTEHILLGVLREPSGVAVKVIMQLGLRPEVVRSDVLSVLGHSHD